jgi:Cu/Ag efflux pump CusA
MDEGDTILQLEKMPSISLQNSIALDLDIQRRILKQVPEVARIVARTGSDELGLDPMGLNETDSFIILKPQDQWQGQSKEQILAKFAMYWPTFLGSISPLVSRSKCGLQKCYRVYVEIWQSKFLVPI